MCGIVGEFRFDAKEVDETSLGNAVRCLHKRGPNSQGTYFQASIGLGHSRLAIIDPEPSANQPFQDSTGRYVLVFNGEIFNYRQLRSELERKGIYFRTKSDTEVLLQLLIKDGIDCLPQLNGFFSFAFYDKLLGKLLLARDKFGEKPLYYFHDENRLLFGSELKSLIALGVPKELDFSSLLFYFQLNYIPSPNSIFRHVHKLAPACWASFEKTGKATYGQYYRIEVKESFNPYDHKKEQLKHVLTQAVNDRLVSDVPLGVFLSGGVDSSIVSLLAKRHSAGIHSFSIGFKDSSFHDESKFAEKVAKHIDLKHHTFYLTKNEMLEGLDDMLSYIDEPFADSSSIAVYNLCKQTKKHVTVALTGDGADEVFGGYNKHLAEAKIRKKSLLNSLLDLSSPLWQIVPSSRSDLWGNEVRKLRKYAESIRLDERQRYWDWCSFTKEQEALRLFSKNVENNQFISSYLERKNTKTTGIGGNHLNEILISDIGMVLEGDMLVKTDRMSMASSMELRSPFLDSRVVDFAFTLHEKDKIDGKAKKILKDTFTPYLPFEVFARPKHGFEVPLLKWLKEDLNQWVMEYLDPSFLREQNLFDVAYVEGLTKKLFSSRPEDVAQRLWGLIVFQYWWKKYYL